MNEEKRIAIMERDVRERLSPKPSDASYLALSDLLMAVKKAATSAPITILDFGSGFAPYRSLFPESRYLRADLASTPNGTGETLGREEEYPEPDCIISDDGKVGHDSDAFDYVLSTQVLEHVRNPEIYLAECFRLLKPGGKLFLTTHGTWHEHGSPYDFRRWTSFGLKYELEKAGFNVLRMEKVTTGPRAMVWFLEMYLSIDAPSRKSLLGVWHWLSRFVPRQWIHRQADWLYPDCRVVPSDVEGHRIYLCLAAYAEKHCDRLD
jgi:SAM-dependent methyltransferase